MEIPFKIIKTITICLLLFSAGSLNADDSAACLECHDDMAITLNGTVHQGYTESQLSAPVKVECTSCHDGMEAHIEDPSPGTILRGDKMTMGKEASLCSRCHITPHQTAMVSTDPHNKTDLNCSSCHTIHVDQSENPVKRNMENTCLSCHTSISIELEMRSAHPLHDMAIECTDCHNLGTQNKPSFINGFNWTCQSCHDEQAGPFLFEHPVTYYHLVEGSGCTECHRPHGSVNDRLLKQPNSGTCLQCHSIPPGHLTNHSGLGAKLECTQCHSEIHGSYESHLFLDPDLGTKLFPDCFQSGCHSLNGN